MLCERGGLSDGMVKSRCISMIPHRHRKPQANPVSKTNNTHTHNTQPSGTEIEETFNKKSPTCYSDILSNGTK